jgi:hypothetical protein
MYPTTIRNLDTVVRATTAMQLQSTMHWRVFEPKSTRLGIAQLPAKELNPYEWR